MAVELATAYISLVPSLKGASSKISQELGSVDTGPAGNEMGRKMGGGIVGSMKSIVGPAMAIAGSAMFAGFIKDAAAASDATDKFKATMSFAGLDTSAITAAKDAAKSYADQTVYDLPTIQNMTAQLASNGVKDYTGLTQAAGNLNAVAGGNAETFKSVAMVMTQTAGAGKLTTENWNQMADAIPGAAGPLMKSLEEAGAYTGNFRDAMAAGQITSVEFNAALQKLGNDPVAVEAAKSTKTFEGAIGSLQATINSGLMGALDALKPAITGAISGLATGLGAIFGAFGAIFTLFKTGDFNGGIRKALGLEEDSAIVGAILTIRNGALGLKSAFSGEGITSDGFVGVMERIGVGAREAILGVKAMRSAFSGEGVTSDGFIGAMERIGVTVRSVVDKVGPTLGTIFAAAAPMIGQVGAAIGPLLPQFFGLFSALSPVQTIFKSIEPLLPQLLSVFGQLATVIGGTLMSALTTLVPIFMQMQGVVVSLFQQVLAVALPIIVQLVTMLGQTLAQLLPVVMPIIIQIATLAMTLVSQLAPILMQLISAVLPVVVTIFGAVLQAIGPLITMIAGLLIPIIQALMPVVVTVFGVVASIITSVMQIVQGVIQVVTGIISGNWSQVWEGIQNIFGGIWNTIVAVVTGVLGILWSVISAGLNLVFAFIGSILGSIGQFFADTWNNIVGAVSGAIGFVSVAISSGFSLWWGLVTSTLGNIGSFFADTWNNITNGISNFVGGIGKFFAGIPDTIMSALSGAGSWLFNVGKDIINGLLDGIGSMMGAIGNAILSLIPGPIVGVFKSALGIASPSKVFRGFGKNIVEGLILGTGDKTDDLTSTMRDLVTVPDAPSFSSSAASMPGSASSLDARPIYVQNPFTGEYLLAQVGAVASGVVAGADSNSQYMRRGR